MNKPHGWIALLCLFGSGCASMHPVHYYTLESASPQASPSQPKGLTILVGNIVTSEALEDDRIRYRAGLDVGTYEYHQWVERPTIMVRDSLMAALGASGCYQRVLESNRSAAGDYLLRGRLYEFEELDRPAIQADISLRLELVDEKTNLTVWEHLFQRQEPAHGKSIDDVVAAMDRALHQVSHEAATEVGTFLASARH